MASDSHEGSGGDTPGEGNAVETRSRHASCEEEPPAHTPSSPALSGAADRRFSLPTALPVSSDILAAPVPEYSPRPRNSVVVSLGRLAPQSDSWYRSCPHRTHVWEGGPPCYLCSMLDLPPKYRRREAHGWHRFKEKLTQLSHATVSTLQRGRSLRQDPPAAVFTVNEWRPSDTSGGAPVEEVPASLSAAPDHRQTQERDNPVFDAHDSLEGGVTSGSYLSGVHQHSSTTTALSAEGVSFVPLPPLPASTAAHNPPFFPPQDAPQEAPSKNYNRRLVCQMLYSLLLAIASSTLIITYDQPIIVITSVIAFLAIFVFLPIIAIFECLIRCRTEQDYRNYLQNIMISAPRISPLIH